MSIRGKAARAKNDVTKEKANSTSMPPNQKVNKAEELNLSLYNHWLEPFIFKSTCSNNVRTFLYENIH